MAGQATYQKGPETGDVINNGSTTVTTAGTAVALAVSTKCYEVLIQAQSANTGRVFIGGSAVPNDQTGGIYLDAGESVRINATDLIQIFVNSAVNAEGVTYIYWSD